MSAFQDLSAFKLYSCDCGLLRRLAKLSPETILSNSAGYTEFKGALTENVVLQSLVAQNYIMPYNWSSGNKSELDFILQIQADIIPVEVKSETRLSGKSLSVYSNKYNPSYRIHISMNNLKENDGLVSYPIPLTDWLSKLLP